MKKQELLDKILAHTWCDGIVADPELNEVKPNNDKWYLVNVREINGDVMTYKNIHFYVIDEGKPEERAYYKDTIPIAILTQQEVEPTITASNEGIVKKTMAFLDKPLFGTKV